MYRERELKIIRRAYAKQVTAAAGVGDPQVEAAFVAVAREDFLGPGPWHVVRWGGGYRATPDADPIGANMSERFTEILRAASEPAWSDAVRHRFVNELFAGAVPDAVMARYLIPDHRFLDSFLTLLGDARQRRHVRSQGSVRSLHRHGVGRDGSAAEGPMVRRLSAGGNGFELPVPRAIMLRFRDFALARLR